MATTTLPTNPQYHAAGGSGIDSVSLSTMPLDAAKIRARWEASQKATLAERRSYWVNAAMLSGEQWLVWNDVTSTLDLAPETDRVRVKVNRLKSSSRTIIAKLLRRPLVFEVPATAADDASASGARIGSAVLADVHSRHNWEELRRQQAWHAWKGGIAVLSVEWDAKAGTELGISEEGKNFGTGDTVEGCWDVTQVAAEPGTRDLEHAGWWIKGVALPPTQVKEMYDLDFLPEADATAMLSPLQRRLLGGGSGRSETTVPLTMVLSYFERPGPDNKKGAVATVVGHRIVDPSNGNPAPWPFPFTDRLNCVAVRETPLDDRWTGETILSDAVPVQVALNQSWSSIVEHMKLAGNARMKIPEGSGDEWDDLSDLPAELVKYFPQPNGQGPEWMSPPAMPQWWIQQPQMLRDEIDDILGVHDVSRGDTGDGGPKSGIGLSILAEQDDTPLGMMAKETAEAWGRLGSLVLRIYEDKVTETRQATVRSAGSAPEVVAWTGKRLSGQTTATVPLDAVEPRSRASQLNLAIQMKQQFADMDFTTFAKIANLPDAQDVFEAVDMDVVKARRENGEMAAGNVTVPADFDNHAKHINEHNTFRKTGRYESLPPDVQKIIEAHIQGHEVDAAREAGLQQAKMAVSPAFAGAAQAHEPPPPMGAPPAPGGAGVGAAPFVPGQPANAVPPPPDMLAGPDITAAPPAGGATGGAPQ